MRSEVGKDLAEIRGKTAELVEKKVAAEDQLKRVDIRAPQDGIVHQLAVHTVGGVIGPGEVIMLIVPEADALDVEAKIQPQDIDQVAHRTAGRPALLRLQPAHHAGAQRRSQPALGGRHEDQKTGARYYTVRIAVPAEELARLGGLKLVPGMPVESFIQTSARTVMSYLVKPLHDQITPRISRKVSSRKLMMRAKCLNIAGTLGEIARV